MSEATWEPKLTSWSKGPGPAEQEKIEHAKTAISKAIDADPTLGSRGIEVLLTGSYANRTNIRVESDVDVAVVYRAAFVTDWHLVDQRAATDPDVRASLDKEAGFRSVTYPDSQYRDEVEHALVEHFDAGAVERGPIAFDVHKNTYRVDSDCVAAFEHRLYMQGDEEFKFIDGIRVTNDVGRTIINYPVAQRLFGDEKHRATDRHFRKVVRIVKNLCVEMNDVGVQAAEDIPSFLIESLVFNVPDHSFGGPTFYLELKLVLGWLFNNTMLGKNCDHWTEANKIKPLFGDDQKWTQEQVHAFISAAWDHVGFE